MPTSWAGPPFRRFAPPLRPLLAALGTAMTIGKRIDEAYEKLIANDYENALIQLSIAVDSTAKNVFNSEKKVGKRIRSYISENEDLLTHYAMNGTLRIFASGGTYYGEQGQLEDVFYKSIRCALLHEGTVEDKIVFKTGTVQGMDDGRFIVTDQMLWGLLLLVVGESANSRQKLVSEKTIRMGEKHFHLSDFWGRSDLIKQITGYKSPEELGIPRGIVPNK